MKGAAGAATILVVDDDADLLDSVAALLELEGFQVIASRDAGDAVARARLAPMLHLLLSDVAMPLAGPLLAEEIRSSRPAVKVLYMSGHPEERARRDFGLPAGAAFLRKPFTRADLARAVRTLLDS